MSEQPPVHPPGEGSSDAPSHSADGPQLPPSGRTSRDYDRDQRTWAMWCHLSALAGFLIPIGNILGPLVVWLTRRHDFPLVDEHGKKALNFQISVIVYWILLFGLTVAGVTVSGGSGSAVALIALAGFVALVIFWIVMVIKAAVRTNDGHSFDYPLAMRFIK